MAAPLLLCYDETIIRGLRGTQCGKVAACYMDNLRLLRVGPEEQAFLQYIPGNLRPLLGQDDIVCVGAVYGVLACGAALAQRDQRGVYDLRYIFIDPAVRLCGLGTYLLRGLLGQLRAMGTRQVRAIYSPSMLEDGRQTLGILQRAGFTQSKPVTTGFSTQLKDLPNLQPIAAPEVAVYSAAGVPQAVKDAYWALLDAGELPPFADTRDLERPWWELSSFCTVHGNLSGWLLVDRKGEGCHVAGLYVLPAFRGSWTAAALIARSIRAAKVLAPPETTVWASAIGRDSFSLCDKLLRLGNRAMKETEFSAVYTF